MAFPAPGVDPWNVALEAEVAARDAAALAAARTYADAAVAAVPAGPQGPPGPAAPLRAVRVTGAGQSGAGIVSDGGRPFLIDGQIATWAAGWRELTGSPAAPEYAQIDLGEPVRTMRATIRFAAGSTDAVGTIAFASRYSGGEVPPASAHVSWYANGAAVAVVGDDGGFENYETVGTAAWAAVDDGQPREVAYWIIGQTLTVVDPYGARSTFADPRFTQPCPFACVELYPPNPAGPRSAWAKASAGAVVGGDDQGAYFDGAVNLTLDTGGTWQPLPGLALAAAAAPGDWIEFGSGHLRSVGPASLDAAVMVGGLPVRYLSSGKTLPAADGLPGWSTSNAPTNFASHPTPYGFTVLAGHLDEGIVRVGLMAKGAGGTLYRSDAYPLYLHMRRRPGT